MDNQHRSIKGYRDLNQNEIDAINAIKEVGDTLEALFLKIGRNVNYDGRWLAIARTQMQLGQMALVRSVAQPEGF